MPASFPTPPPKTQQHTFQATVQPTLPVALQLKHPAVTQSTHSSTLQPILQPPLLANRQPALAAALQQTHSVALQPTVSEKSLSINAAALSAILHAVPDATLPPSTIQIPTPPPRSRYNINHFHPSLLNLSPQRPSSRNSDATGRTLNQNNSAVKINFLNGFVNHTAMYNEIKNHYQERVVTHNNINYNAPSTRSANEEMTVIDCTTETPVMGRAKDVHRRLRSLSASRVPQGLSLPSPNTINFNNNNHFIHSNNNNPYDPRCGSPKTITWIEKTWTTTGCQTVLSYTPKPPLERPRYSNPCAQFSHINKSKSSHNKRVNFVDEPQIEGDHRKLAQDESSQVCPDDNPPPIPTPPDISLNPTPEPPTPPSVSPPPLTPPAAKKILACQKKVAISDVVRTEPPPPKPNRSHQSVTPEPPKVIKPCIKYPKSIYKSHSAPSSPALGGRCLGPQLSIPPTVPPPPTEEPRAECHSSKTSCRLTDDLKLRQKHAESNCEHNCRNCFYI